jgi:UDP-3-O-[3-hydroxymyristoyl] glucosamine N-acyltransferase
MAADPRFHPCVGPQSLAAVAAAAGAVAPEAAEGSFTGIAALSHAGPHQVGYLEHRRYLAQLRASRAGAVLVSAEFAGQVPAGSVALVVRQPALAFARLARLFHPAPAPVPGIHPTAVVAPDAELGPGCEVGPHAVVGAGARIGAGCIIGPHAVVGAGVELGAGCRLHPHASISHAIAGAGVVLHPGARVGQEGFGLVPNAEGGFETMPQLGRVLLGDRVEVGANSTIDRGALDDTVIGPGSRIDNLVQIGHNVRTGRGCVVVAMAGISGSTTLGDYVTVAAQAGLTGHLTIGDKARIGAQSGVMSDVPPGTDVFGSPSMPIREALRAHATLRKLANRTGGKP